MLSAAEAAAAESVAIRGAQVADQIRDLVASWLMRDFQGTIISVTVVTLSSDMRVATVWIRTFPMSKNTGVLRDIRRKVSRYQHNVQRAMPRRNVPILIFRPDSTEEEMERIDTLLK